MATPALKNPINMNGTYREAASVTFVRKMTDEEIAATESRLQMKERPQTLVHFFAPESQRGGIAHPVAASPEQVIGEFAKTGITLTPTSLDAKGKPVEAVHMAAVETYKAFKSSDDTPEERKIFGTKAVFKDVSGLTAGSSREAWLLARPDAFHGERAVPGFGNGGTQ
ncbi:MAG TPA: hypothetical protein VE986_10065 [Hyphomicrobiales bacterium]|nr:hypothetical protein [Hyphomicrobiales bacterium]